jgi:hypothetical protein
MPARSKNTGSKRAGSSTLISEKELRKEAGAGRRDEDRQAQAERGHERAQSSAELTQEAPGADSDGQSPDGGGPRQARNERGTHDTDPGPGMQDRGPSEEPDVFLDVPKVHVGEIYFDVEDLEAHLSLRAKIANLVHILAGVHVNVGKVELDIRGVDAEALLKVRLENLYDILDRVMTTFDRNPEVLQSLLKTVNNAVDDIGQVGQQALGPGGAVGQAVDQVGQVGQQALGPGGAVTEAAEGVGQAAQQAVGPGGAATEASKGVGGAAQQAVQPGGAVSETAGAASQAAQGVGNAAGQAGQGIGQGAGQATQGAAQNAQGAAQAAHSTDPLAGKKQKSAPLHEARALLKQAEESGSASGAG